MAFTFKRILLLATLACATILVVDATQAHSRPEKYQEAARVPDVEENPQVNVVQKRANGKASFAYFTNWGIYGANFQPTDINSTPLTHILYSFADTDSSGAIKLTDSYADQEKHFPSDSWSETGNNLYGCLKQLYLLKLKQRNLKVLLSIGGWTYSQAGHFNFVTNAAARTTFVNSAVQLIEDYGFDGIDIDYEYPSTAALGQGLADLVTSLRSALNSLASRKGDTVPYLITAAVGAGPAGYTYLNIPQMNNALDYWNLMAYDFAGSWLTYADHQANLYGGVRTGFSGDAAVSYYISKGATASKINLGMPMYGRAFEATSGIGQPYTGIGPGTIEAGIYSYKFLPLAGATIVENNTDVTSYSYDSSKRELVSYDTPNIVRKKVSYINSRGLGGSMFWELSTDRTGADSLVTVSASGLGALDSTQNHIKFPSSKWDNIKNNMGGGGTTPTDPPPTGCGGVSAWSAATAYVGGSRVSYNNHLWTAKWWTQNEVPGGASGVWTDGGAC